MSEKNKGNIVSNQSKLWMENSILKLMETENYSEITIQEITDNAGLSRRTFYRNYTDKNEILEGYFCKIWTEYRTHIAEEKNLSLPNIARVFFTIMEKYIDFLLLVNRHQLLPLFLTKVDELLPIAFHDLKGKDIPLSNESIRYSLTFSTGGFMRILILWLNEGAKKSPEEMSALVQDFFILNNYSLNKTTSNVNTSSNI